MNVQENHLSGGQIYENQEEIDYKNLDQHPNKIDIEYYDENKASSPSLVSQDYDENADFNGIYDDEEDPNDLNSDAEHHKSNKNIHSIQLHQSRRSENLNQINSN